MTATLSLVKNHIENSGNLYGGYNAIIEVTFKKPIRKRFFSTKISKIRLGGIIPGNENRSIAGLVFFTSDIGLMFEYENNQFIAHYKTLKGNGIEGWKEYENKEVLELKITMDNGNPYQQALPNSTLNLLKEGREADFIIKSPIDKIVDVLNKYFGNSACNSIQRSKIDNSILDIYLKGDLFIEKEVFKKVLNDNLIWHDLQFFGFYEIFIHSEQLKKRIRFSPNS